MLQPTRITLFVVLWFMMLVGSTVAGVVCGAQAFGVLGSIIGGVIGLVVGHVLGKLPDVLSTKWLLRKLWRSSDEELWSTVNLGFWNFTQTFALLTLAGRNQDVRTQLPRIIGMLEADDQLTRVYGWDALRLVFDAEANAMGEYDPRASTEACRLRVADLRQKMAERCQPGASPNGGPTERLGDSGVSGGPPAVS
ncbi:MAG TPA: hypothetical protein VN673_12760 [Clostridia bacterium]|nr:hypothetical protein [Clostridia bacterium]